MHMKYLHLPQTTPKTNINNLHVITHIIFDNPKRRLHTNNCYSRNFSIYFFEYIKNMCSNENTINNKYDIS